MRVIKISDFIGGLVIDIFTLIYFIQTFTIKKIAVLNSDSALIPRICAISMFILASVLTVQGLAKGRDKEAQDTSSERKEEYSRKLKSALTAVVILGAAILMMKPLGFIISMIFYLIASFITLSKKEERKYLQFVILAVVSVTSIYLIFVKVFDLLLPAGILG